MLDTAGLRRVRIFVSGSLDEYAIDDLIRSGAPVDAAGVGTKVGVAADAPYLDTAYKLISYAGRPVRKVSPGKATMSGAKQVWRPAHPDGPSDVITLRDETVDGADPLLEQVVTGGVRTTGRSTLGAAHERFVADLERLPASARRLRVPDPLRACFSAGVERLAAETDRRWRGALVDSGTPKRATNGAR